MILATNNNNQNQIQIQIQIQIHTESVQRRWGLVTFHGNDNARKYMKERIIKEL